MLFKTAIAAWYVPALSSDSDLCQTMGVANSNHGNRTCQFSPELTAESLGQMGHDSLGLQGWKSKLKIDLGHNQRLTL